MAAPNNAVPNALSTMTEQELKQLFREMNVSTTKLAAVTSIHIPSVGRWMRSDAGVFGFDKFVLLMNWIRGKTIDDVKELHSRKFCSKLHQEVSEEVQRGGEVDRTRLSLLKRKCVDAQEASQPPPSKPRITETQVCRIVTTKERKAD